MPQNRVARLARVCGVCLLSDRPRKGLLARHEERITMIQSSAPASPAMAEGGAEVTRRPGRRTIAVTGACTFMGRNLIALLEEDPTVRRIVVLDIKNAPTAGAKSRFYQVDLTEPGVDSRVAEILHADGVQCLAHLAFRGSPTQAVAWAHELETVGTMHILSACRQHALPRLVVTSSTMVYGAHSNNPNYLDEEQSPAGLRGSPMIQDRIDVERQVVAYRKGGQRHATILRMAPMLGPTVDNYLTRWLSRVFVPTVLGHDPLVQFLHEVDAVAALKLAVDLDRPGTFNVVGAGVLPVTTVVKLAGRVPLPIPYGIFRRLASMMWVAQLSEAPPAFAAALKYLCVADGARAASGLGFQPAYSTRDAVLDFEGALRLREARLLDAAAGAA